MKKKNATHKFKALTRNSKNILFRSIRAMPFQAIQLFAIPMFIMAHTSFSKAENLNPQVPQINGYYKIISSGNELLDTNKKTNSLISPIQTYAHIENGIIEIISMNSQKPTKSISHFFVTSDSENLFLEIRKECDLKNYVPVRQLHIDPHGLRIHSTVAGVNQNIIFAYETKTTLLEIPKETYEVLSSQISTLEMNCLETQTTFDRFTP